MISTVSEGVGAEVDELGVGRDGVEVGAELLGDDGAHLLQGVGALRFFLVLGKKNQTGQFLFSYTCRTHRQLS
jgi:hypothetical protein